MASARGQVLVGMSGGVDSAVAAALLQAQGWDVTGAFVCMGRAAEADAGASGCCSPQDAADARRVAGLLGVDLFVLDAGRDFERVIDAFAAEYAAGRTPNPCIGCNRDVKFGRLLRRARDLGFDAVATGHYARVVQHRGAPALARARAAGKDQSYVLFELPRQALGRLVLPLGEVESKAEVRATARRLGLPVHDKPDSQEICFVPAGGYVQYLAERAPETLAPGPIVHVDGRVLGEHAGIAGYTVGQRRRLPASSTGPLYVVALDPATRTVIVGPESALYARECTVDGLNWVAIPGLAGPLAVSARIRYNAAAAPAHIEPDERAGCVSCRFERGQRAITPGQAAVFYTGDVVVGGGAISSVVGSCV